MAYSTDQVIATVEESHGFYRVQYQRAGELVASFRWCDTVDEVNELLSSIGYPFPYQPTPTK